MLAVEECVAHIVCTVSNQLSGRGCNDTHTHAEVWRRFYPQSCIIR